MKNFVEELKIYWKAGDLIFIATFNKVNNKHGYFRNFINPLNKMKLYYPEYDGVEVLDKRISFYYDNNSNLSDGTYYKVELENTDNPKGKNNPYSLKIKAVSEINQNKIEEFLSKNSQDEVINLKYFGAYSKISESFACFENVMSSETGEILMSQGESQKVFVSPKINLNEGSYYTFSFIENEGKLPSG